MKNVYAIMYGCYDELCIAGYFTNREDADKYCAAHPNAGYFVEVISCLDGKEDLSHITLKYQYEVLFNKTNDGWAMKNEPDRYVPYIADYLRSNSIKRNTIYCISIVVNTTKDDRKLAVKIAHDILHQYLDSCDNKPNDISARKINEILAAEEIERKKKADEEKVRVKELAELERLKAKYENYIS